MFARLAVLASLAASTFANVYMTSPVASTVCEGNTACLISWQDDGTTPTLASFGNATVGLMVGSTNEQTQLQLITSSVNVSTTASINFTIDPTVGEDSSDYFIKFTSANSTEVFSSKFQITNMTGTFNSTILAQIAAEDAQISSESAAAASTSKASSATTKATGSSTASGSAASSSASTSSAGRVEFASGIVGLAGAVAAVLTML